MKLEMTETRLDGIGNALYDCTNLYVTTTTILKLFKEENNVDFGTHIFFIISKKMTSKYTMIKEIISLYENMQPL